MRPEVEERILDIGGFEGPWERMGLLDRVTVVNLDPGGDHKTRFVQADGTALPFTAKSFGLVYSNSVIEHVGDFVDQRQLAEEIRRVGQRYWVQAPDRSFPIEPHFLFPGFQLLPLRARLWIGPRWPISWPRQFGWTRARIEAEIRELRLPTARELQALFPEGVLYYERFIGLTKSLVVHSTVD